MSKLLRPILAAALTYSLATPATASPFAHGFANMAQEPVAPEAAPQPGPAPGPAPVAQPYPGPQPYPSAQPYPAPQPYPQPYPAADPQYAQPQPAPMAPPPRGRRKGLMIGGWTMFGASYLFTALTGAVIADGKGVCSDAARCERVGYYMMIPVAGPFIATGPSNSAVGTAFLGIVGIIQTAGLVMGIVGTAQFVADGRQQQTVLNADGFRLTRNRNLRLNASPTASHGQAGGMVGLNYRF